MTTTTDDVMGAAFVALFATTVLVALAKLPNVDEALHFYQEDDPRVFVAMRACQVVITTAMVVNARFIIGWALQGCLRRLAWV